MIKEIVLLITVIWGREVAVMTFPSLWECQYANRQTVLEHMPQVEADSKSVLMCVRFVRDEERPFGPTIP